MHGPPPSAAAPAKLDVDLNLLYLWLIALVAALGGLLFGYDWVVIGGAKPFYEVYFHLSSESQMGWANSCALVGCFAGSMIAGLLSDRFGRKRVLLLSGVLFALSSVLTGWSFQFAAFVLWRIVGGLAIGLASNVSPTYIAEISPAQWRGRLVSLNQLALVVGILTAQIANWQIAAKVAPGLSHAQLFATWNVQYGWRWMFTAVAVPALVLLICLRFIPESPRWLAGKHRDEEAGAVLEGIGGKPYRRAELDAIRASLAGVLDEVSWRELLRSPVLPSLVIGVVLAVLQQGSGINILFNYAADVYRDAGYGVNDILFNIVITGAINLVFTVVAMLLVDRFGRRPLMLFGCVSIGVCQLAASLAYRMHLHGFPILALTLTAIACYAMTLAPITWVLITEIFPNRYRGIGVSISIGALWIASFVLTYTFPTMNRWVGSAGSFLLYAGICFIGGLFVFLAVPETRGRSLESSFEASRLKEAL